MERGQHWAILGPNGCGKTSLLKALTAYMTPTRGTIDLLGRRFGRTDWRELRTQLCDPDSVILRAFGELLAAHVRFEEREMFIALEALLEN